MTIKTVKYFLIDYFRLIRREQNQKRRRRRNTQRETIVGHYVKYDEVRLIINLHLNLSWDFIDFPFFQIIDWLQYMGSLYTHFMQNISIGRTYENKELIVFKVSEKDARQVVLKSTNEWDNFNNINFQR